MISTGNLMTVQAYSLYRREHRKRLIAHRRVRTVPLGPAMRLQFEDELTVRHRIQEALRTDRSDDLARMQDEIDAYAHLVPDGTQWQATLSLAWPDTTDRQPLQAMLQDAARRLYIEAGRQPRAWGQPHDEQSGQPALPTSDVRFLRFQLPDAMRSALLHARGTVVLGCDHPHYHWRRCIPPQSLDRLRRDLVCPVQRAPAAFPPMAVRAPCHPALTTAA